MKTRPFMIFAALLSLGLALPLPAVRAEDPPSTIEADDDHETARKALEQHEILPLGRVLALIEEKYPGDVIEIELERQGALWIYDLELIDAEGRVRELDIDARTGEVLKDAFDR
ncbi:PepSY domain-containing protein [Dongia sp.]|uniref:PepSY domain-containing protein n=1 Tax=Dongia sp. TaxID=1977262 RepID=UPI0035AEF514